MLVRMWQVTSSRIAYGNPWIQVVEDRVIGPDGAPGLYGVVEVRNPAVFIVAVNDAGEVLFESVDRHTVGPSLEIPAGGNDGEDLLVAAKRELYEETGYVAERWQPIGSMNALNGVCRAAEHVFLAQGLSRSADGADAPAEGISAVSWVPWPEVISMIAAGTITDGETLASLLHAAIALGRISGAAPEASGQTPVGRP
jgi:8-oxo-dGTP pyrophosphatase MutT (NUDIX family)